VSDCRIVVIGLVLAACLPCAQATTITDLGHTADLIVVARLDRIDRKAETTSTGSRYGTAQLNVIQVIKGSSASQMLQAAIVSSRKPCFAAGGSGPGPCFSLSADMPVSTGIWFLKSVEGAWEIIPKQLHGPLITYDDLFLPLTGNPGAVPAPGALDDRLLAYEVRWFQSLADPDIHSIDEPFYSCFQDRNSQSPTQQQVLRAIAPLIASRYPGQHAAGLVLALRFDSVDAMNQVVNELPALRSNPRFPEILSAIGSAPPGGKKDPRFVVPLRQLIALHADVPGLDAAMAAALYRTGTRETWPLLGELLESKDAYAQTVAARTLGILVPAQEAPGNDPRLPYEVAFWKAWWAGNRARLGFAGVASTAKNSSAPAGVLPPPFINPDGVIRGDTNRPGMFPPGTLIGIWGHNFGPAAGCNGDATALCGVQVLLDGKPIAIQFVTDVQINARIPDDTPGQPISRLTVVSGGRTSDPVEVHRTAETVTIALDGVARVDGPVWIHVDSLRATYPPMRIIPWEFACDTFEVRKDGKPLAPLAHGMGGYGGSGNIPSQRETFQRSTVPLPRWKRFYSSCHL